MTLLEAEVHSSLLRFLRSQSISAWPHHLTMARIVARALRLRRSALVQTGSTVARYSLSYLTPALLNPGPVVLVASESQQKRLLEVDIPPLQASLATQKPILAGDRYPHSANFQGLFLTSPHIWLKDRLENLGRFPPHIPTLIEQAEGLHQWAGDLLTRSLAPADWLLLRDKYPEHLELLRSSQIKLTKLLFSRPKNPYNCFLLDDLETACLQELLEALPLWPARPASAEMLWASLARDKGQFTLHLTPADMSSLLQPIWQQQPLVFIGGFLDSEKEADTYRKQLGIGSLLCLKFSNSRSNNILNLYIPSRLPMPNTPEFKDVVITEICQLVNHFWTGEESLVILVEDVPLKPQIAAILAAKFGSVVQVEKPSASAGIILVCGWQFWHENQELVPTPQLLILSTLPLPSPENPLVAGRITYYKQNRQDWFHSYLLPTALKEIEKAIAPLRETQGTLALLDNRVNFRSYGTQILSLLEPYARINYIDRNEISYGRF